MKIYHWKEAIFVFLIFFLILRVCDAQKYKRSIRNPERELFGKSLNTKRVKYREAPSIVRAKKKQAAKIKKDDKDYYAFVKKSRKHALEIQSPEVKSRMISNRKEADLKYKEKKKRNKETTRKAEKRYN